MTDGKKTFEDRLADVQGIISRIEEGNLPLEDSVRQFEEGMKTLEALEAEVGDMNRRLTVLRDGREQEMAGLGEKDEDL